MSSQKPRSLGTLGAESSAKWLAILGLEPVARWYAEIVIAQAESRFCLNVYAEEWGYALHHDGRDSWIRVTDIPFVHGRDDFSLLDHTPDLTDVGALIARIEKAHGLELARRDAEVRTNLANAAEVIRAWLVHPMP